MAMAPTRYASLGHFGMRIFHLECLCNSSLYVCNTYRTQTVFANAAVMVVVGIEIEREGEGAIARVLGAGGGRPRGFAHGRQERRDFLLISCLIRLIHLLSLYREVYLIPKQATN